MKRVLLFLFLLCPVFAKAEVLFEIGKPDGYVREFKIFRGLGDGMQFFTRNYEVNRRPYRNLDKSLEFFSQKNFEFVVGKNKDCDWPYIHPVRNCDWGQMPFACKIKFNVNKGVVESKKDFFFRLGFADASAHYGGLGVKILLNGKQIADIRDPYKIAKDRFNAPAVLLYHPKTYGKSLTVKTKIAANTFKEGENILEIAPHDTYKISDKTLWFAYDYLSLSDNEKDCDVEYKGANLLDRAISAMGTEYVVFATRSDTKDPHWFATFGKSVSIDAKNETLQKNFGKYMDSHLGAKIAVFNLRTKEIKYILDDPNGSVHDLRLHYDAKKLLFAYRKGKTKTFHLYEMDIDGKNFKLLPMAGDWDDIEPAYLPNDDIVYCSSRHRKTVQCGILPIANLTRYSYTDNSIRALSVNPDQDNTPSVLKDGRIVYLKWDYNQRSQLSFHHLWTLNPDGTSDKIFFGNRYPGGVFLSPKEFPDRHETLFVISPYHGETWNQQGRIAKVKNSCDPSDIYALDFVSGDSGYNFFAPFPLKDGLMLTNTRNKLFVMDEFGHFENIDLPKELFETQNEEYTVTLINNQRKRELFVKDIQPLAKRPREKLIPDSVDYSKKTAIMSLQNIYFGRQMQGVEKGSIKKLVVVEFLPNPAHYHGGTWPISHSGAFAIERIWGYVDVNEDGSAIFEVPAQKALAFIALDKNGNCVKRMLSFVGAQPSTSTSCIGCHETRNETPLTNTVPKSFSQAVQKLKPFDNRKHPFVIDFMRDIQPIFNAHCIKCHSDNPKSKAKFSLMEGMGATYFHSYFNLFMRKQMQDGENKWGMFAPYKFGSGCSKILSKTQGAHHNAKLSEQELETLKLWLDTGATQFGTYAALGTVFLHQNLFDTPQWKMEDEIPQTNAMFNVIKNRCGQCHKGNAYIPAYLNPYNKIRTVKNNKVRETIYHNETAYNFLHPERTIYLNIALAKEEGGLAEKGVHPVIFKDKKDPDYISLKNGIYAISEHLKNNYPMHLAKNFRAGYGYFVRLQEAGIFRKNASYKTPVNPFESDERYFRWIEDTMYMHPPKFTPEKQ